MYKTQDHCRVSLRSQINGNALENLPDQQGVVKGFAS